MQLYKREIRVYIHHCDYNLRTTLDTIDIFKPQFCSCPALPCLYQLLPKLSSSFSLSYPFISSQNNTIHSLFCISPNLLHKTNGFFFFSYFHHLLILHNVLLLNDTCFLAVTKLVDIFKIYG